MAESTIHDIINGDKGTEQVESRLRREGLWRASLGDWSMQQLKAYAALHAVLHLRPAEDSPPENLVKELATTLVKNRDDLAKHLSEQGTDASAKESRARLWEKVIVHSRVYRHIMVARDRQVFILQ